MFLKMAPLLLLVWLSVKIDPHTREKGVPLKVTMMSHQVSPCHSFFNTVHVFVWYA